MRQYRPEKIYIERSVADKETTLQIISKFAGIPVHYVDDPRNEHGEKNSLFIGKNMGSFIKRCPGARNYICCNYYIINLYNNCPLECSYCILQDYINNSFVTIYVNVEDMLNEVGNILSKNKETFYRIGTGELGDSLALDGITEYSRTIISFFARQKNALLELKTKTDMVGNLLDIEHNSRTVVSWSINPEKLIKEEEPKTAPLEQRLIAARLCQRAGYFLGIHFDPLIVYPGWEDDYRDIIMRIYQYIDPKGIMWISLGTLRYPPGLRAVIRDRFPESRIVTGEFINGNDGKMRYIKAIRKDIYSKIISYIKRYDSDPFIYLCMESKDMWQRTIGWRPEDDYDLDVKFQQRVRKLLNRGR